MASGESISVHELKTLTAVLFDKLTRAGFDTIPVSHRFYWSVFPADAFSIDRPELVMSDIADDLDDLRGEVSDDESGLSLGMPWHALHHLAGIFSAMAAATLEPETVRGSAQ